MDYQEFPAPPPLDLLVTCVWFLSGRGDGSASQPVVPDGHLELLLHMGDPFSRIDPDGRAHRQGHLLAAGQLTSPIKLSPGPWIDVVGVRLTPLGAYAILGLPLAQLTNQVIFLPDVNPRAAAALERAATRGVAPADRAGLIVYALARLVREGPDRRMIAALDFLASGHQGQLASLASRCNMSLRTLERRFLSQVGLTPKMYHRVVRFRRTFRWLGMAEQGGWARVAVRAGYYDQAHLIRDFTRFAGAPPTVFFRSDPALAQAFSTGA